MGWGDARGWRASLRLLVIHRMIRFHRKQARSEWIGGLQGRSTSDDVQARLLWIDRSTALA